ncbi:MAG: cob(I)yrinic acid a,c-diamide adenosyltransferase, partial [Candidatus Micrarchaeota archaeon]|nr:cob(I)yrinic acid a,c-diamide adenosyltransferase [Candidatus Micrarchaeota archaeon]
MSTKYFTGRGDDGTTGILSNKRVRKDDALIEAIGNLDELNSVVGVALGQIKDETVRSRLMDIQNTLFVLGANLASTNEKKMHKAQIKDEAKAGLEAGIGELSKKIPELKQFVLPGGTSGSSQLHQARAVARRCERSAVAASKHYKVDAEVIAYLNRLSSYLFVAALYLNHMNGTAERHPT